MQDENQINPDKAQRAARVAAYQAMLPFANKNEADSLRQCELLAEAVAALARETHDESLTALAGLVGNARRQDHSFFETGYHGDTTVDAYAFLQGANAAFDAYLQSLAADALATLKASGKLSEAERNHDPQERWAILLRMVCETIEEGWD